MDYRATLNLPQTSFKMKANLSQKEPMYLKRWEKEDLYGQLQERSKDKHKLLRFVVMQKPNTRKKMSCFYTKIQ